MRPRGSHGDAAPTQARHVYDRTRPPRQRAPLHRPRGRSGRHGLPHRSSSQPHQPRCTPPGGGAAPCRRRYPHVAKGVVSPEGVGPPTAQGAGCCQHRCGLADRYLPGGSLQACGVSADTGAVPSLPRLTQADTHAHRRSLSPWPQEKPRGVSGSGTVRGGRRSARAGTMRSAAAAWTRVVRAQRQSGGVGCRSGADARPGTLCSGLGATRGIHRAIDNAYNSLARLNGSFFAQGACAPPSSFPTTPTTSPLPLHRCTVEGRPTQRAPSGRWDCLSACRATARSLSVAWALKAFLTALGGGLRPAVGATLPIRLTL